MENDNYTAKLCGGTFFVLLRNACDQGATDTNILIELIKIFRPDYKMQNVATFRRYTSEYKNCKGKVTTRLRLDDDIYVQSFDIEIKKNYHSVLSRMEELTKNYISDPKRGVWLVKALLELIDFDRDITNEQCFYTNRDGIEETKLDISNKKDFYLPAFLLGIWHYIIVNKIDNAAGEETLNDWHHKEYLHSRPEFISNIGSNYRNNVNISYPQREQPDDSTTMRKITRRLGTGLDVLFETPISEIMNENEELEDLYYETSFKKYNKLKTLLYNDQPRKFYDFYVCNHLIRKTPFSRGYYSSTIFECDLDGLKKISKYIIITGTGGLGKSMMMRHLLLSTIERRNINKCIPILIPVKNYNPSEKALLNGIYDIYKDLRGEMSEQEFNNAFDEGRFLILFDGLDEIRASYKELFEDEIELLTDKYPSNTYVISSRPYSSFVRLSKFTVLELSPFSKFQAEELIEKLEFRPDDPTIKKRFADELDKRLYKTHKEFCENPLLLTIMLMTFEQFAEVPSKMHVFYREAYITLSQKHDATKGAFQRSFKTELANDTISAEQFEKLFAEFCALSYYDEKYEFSELEISNYFNRIKYVKNGLVTTDYKKFIEDLIENICMMYYEGGMYCFIHRSLQEYFCAVFFSLQKDKTLPSIGHFFDKKGGIHKSDKTFDMLYDMIPDKVEEYIFLDYLKDMFENRNINSYLSYLQYQYGTISYIDGEIGYEIGNDPDSFIFYKLCVANNLLHDPFEYDLPFYSELTEYEYFYVDEHYDDLSWLETHEDEWLESDNSQIVSDDEIYSSYSDVYGDPDHAGWQLEFEVIDVLKNADTYKDLIDAITNEGFPLYVEYVNVKNYYERLLAKQQQAENSDDFFEQFI